jgi:N-acyl homoserine lactone hydrolase
MTQGNAGPQKLYLLKLSSTIVPVAPDRTLDMVLGCYLVETGDGKHILIDTGIAPDVPPRPGMVSDPNATTVLEQLSALGLRPEDVDTLICTHFDVDHVGFNDRFPRAELIVQREQYELARGGHARFAAGRAHWDHPDLRYRLVDGDTELLPGLTLLATGGHTYGHQSVLVRLPRTGLVLLAIDAVMLRRLFTPDRAATPADQDEGQLRASTQKLLDLVEREHEALVIFGHDGEQWRTLKTAPEFYD